MKTLILAVMFASVPAAAQEFAAEMPAMRDILTKTHSLKASAAALAATRVDARMVKEVFGVTLEPIARLHGRLIRLYSVGDFELSGGQCVAAVSQGRPSEKVEVIHKEAIFDTKGYGVTSHTFVLILDSSRRSYFVMDVVVQNSQTTRDPVFGAFGAARQAHQVYQARLSEALVMSARCPASNLTTP